MKIKKTAFNFAIISILIVGSFSIWLAGNLGAFGINKIVYDVIGYHGYFPAVFIKKDLSLNFYKDSTQFYSEKGMYCANFTIDKKPIFKYTYGVSAMCLPFTLWPYLFDKSLTTGYELPFSIAIAISNLFYYILAFILIYKLLSHFRFSKFAIGLTILCIGLGTNSLAYASIGLGMPHAYGLFLTSSLLYLCVKWHQRCLYKYSFLLGIVFGLLVLMRPTNIIFGLCFFIYKRDGGGITPIKFFLSKWKHLLLISILAFLIVLPQLLYWKYITGHFFYNSYVGEHFYFDRPRIWQFLVGFRKGWLIYSPLILAGLIGLFYSRRINPFFICTLVVIPVLIYLNSSWWCWWFGGSYGARSMIETYPLLALGFVSLFDRILARWKKITCFLCTFFILFNIKSVDLYRANIIHFDSMTYKAFFYTSVRIFFSTEDKDYLRTLYKKPDYAKALRGEDS